MKNIFVILVAIVVFLAILEVSASRPNLEEHKLLANTKSLISGTTEVTKTVDKKEASKSDMTESDGQENDSSTNTHHYFPCAKQSECGNEIRT